ncbi:MAG: hypothetical protein RR224_06250 [Clostridia bacterium]
MQGSFVIFWMLYGIVLLLLFAPVRLRVVAAMTMHGGRVNMTIRFLLLKFSIPLRITLEGQPYCNVVWMKRDGRTRRIYPMKQTKKAKPRWISFVLEALEKPRVALTWIVGAGDAATTAVLCGVLGNTCAAMLKIGLPDVWTEVSTLPLFSAFCLRLNLEGITKLRLAEVIRVVLEKRGGQ